MKRKITYIIMAGILSCSKNFDKAVNGSVKGI